MQTIKYIAKQDIKLPNGQFTAIGTVYYMVGDGVFAPWFNQTLTVQLDEVKHFTTED